MFQLAEIRSNFSFYSSINPDEKKLLKTKLLESFNEPIDQLATQYAVIISKIARLDCPDDWEELMPLLLQRVNSSDELEQKRSLQILVQVVKSLSTRRLQHDRMIFERLSSNLYEFGVNLWNGFTGLYFQNIQSNSELSVCENNLKKAISALKIVRKLTIHGTPNKPNQDSQPIAFLKTIFDRIKDLLECRLLIKSSAYISLLEPHEKFILKHLKILIEFQEHHRSSFIEFAPFVLEMSFNYAFFEGTRFIFEGNELTMPNFVIHCLNLIKGYLLNSSGNIYSSSTNETDIKLAETLKNFFTNERLGYMIEKLLMHYFLITPLDIEQWESDPENFVSDEGGDSWKYNLRSCTEAFYMALFHKYSSVLCQHLKVYVEKSQAIQLSPSSSVNDILIKESIYNAVGLVAFHLFDDIDFDSWFTSQLLVELKLHEPNFKVLRRRIIWMIAQWSGVKFSKTLRPLLYDACLELLQSNEDMVVRLTAAKTLKTVLEDFDFCAEQFLEFLEPAFTLLFNVLKEAKECDTKMNVLYVMAFIVEKMSLSIKVQAGNLVAYLPLLWNEGIEHNMLRIAIISALLQIIKAIDEIPEQVVPFIYQVIEISTNVNDPSTVYLMDEGLELWLTIIQYTPEANDALIKLCDNIVPIIGENLLLLLNCTLLISFFLQNDQL